MKIFNARPVLEGAGVRLHRVFSNPEVPLFDPFLLLDDLSSENPADYLPGFPWHPHRGIETVTYVIAGEVDHGDSIGNSGKIESGQVQWMTAGNGIIHREMPQEFEGRMQGFQLWVNLPAKSKMMQPRYRGITAKEIPTAKTPQGAIVKVIAGQMGKIQGPVKDLVVECSYFDVELKPNSSFEHDFSGLNAFAYVFQGNAIFGETAVRERQVVLLGRGKVLATSGKNGARFLMCAGKPLKEPVAWYGPIVMNTREELELAFRELDEGTFIKRKKSQAPETNSYYRK